MKIVIATAVYHPMVNGVAVFSHNLATGLAARGHEVMVLCPSLKGRSYTRTVDGVKTVYLKSIKVRVYPDQVHAVPPRKKFLGFTLPHLFYKNGFRVSVFPARAVSKALSKFSPDVVHVQVSDPIGLSVVSYAKKHGIPVVTTEHNQPEVLTEPLHVPGLIKRPVDALLSAYFVNRQSKSDFVTMPTEKAISNLIWSKGREFSVPVAAVSNGVDLTHFKPDFASAKLYKDHGLSPDFKTVLYLGRLDPEKNVAAIIEAFEVVSENLSGVQLMIVGDGVDKARLMHLAEGYDNIHFLGRITPPELYKVYQLGDIFATASEIETQGIVLIEAAACGMPLIAVDKGAVGEVCRDGENGILCKPGDVAGIAAAMKKLLSDDKLREKYGKKSLEIAKEHDFEKTLDKFINIYEHVVKDKH